MFVGPALGVKRYPGWLAARGRDGVPSARSFRFRAALSRPCFRERACYSDVVGRLDNIVARNRRPNRLQERVIVSSLFGLIVLLVIGLAVFTDLGRPPEAPEAGDARDAGPAAGAVPDHTRVNRVLLRKPGAKPAPTPAPATAH